MTRGGLDSTDGTRKGSRSLGLTPEWLAPSFGEGKRPRSKGFWFEDGEGAVLASGKDDIGRGG